MTDAFSLVLHSHLPYVRGAGRWPHGEEWVHEAILGTYLPLLVVLHDLRDEGIRYRVTIGLTPTLLEQLADREINARFREYVDDQVRRAELDAWDLAGTNSDRAALAEFYRASYARLRDAYLVRFSRDIVGAFADLARTGEVEILTSAATHGYLPLLDDASVAAQLAVGRATTQRLTGLVPSGIWLPECAYRPGLERVLEAQGLTHFFTDADLLRGSGTTRSPRRFGRSTWGRSGESSAAEHPLPADQLDGIGGTAGAADVMRSYLVADSSVAVMTRHPAVSGQVWSAAAGYPGDPAYREFHRKDDRSGLRYWSVTATTVDLGAKAPYVVADAAARVKAHAAHFAASVRRTLEAHRAATGVPGLLTTAFDSELFGHWWFEGVDWLGLVLRDLGPLTVTAASWLSAGPPCERVPLAEGSWGKLNDHSTWQNTDTAWMWDGIRRGVAAVRSLAAAPPLVDGVRRRAADQAVRELLLLESSDWPFLVTTGQAADYGAERFRAHAERLHRCVELAQRGSASDEAELHGLERTGAVFPEARIALFGPGPV